MMLTDTQIERYQRHILLREVGGEGQKALLGSSVAVVGAGGLGCPLLTYLVAAGIGRISIIDNDHVSLSNLQRQALFTTADVGLPKVDVAAARLRALNPDVELLAVESRLTPENAAALLAGHSVIADGCDNFRTRSIVNRAAVALAIPLATAAIGPFEGQLGSFAGHLPGVPCWACFAGAPDDIPGTSCADVGVLGALAGLVGAAQAMEVLRLILGFGQSQIGRIWLFEALSLGSRSVRIAKDPACPVCAA